MLRPDGAGTWRPKERLPKVVMEQPSDEGEGVVKAVTPTDIRRQKQVQKPPIVIPQFIIEAFNNAISRYMGPRGVARFNTDQLFDEVKLTAAAHGRTATKQEMLDSGWLKVEGFFNEAGWSVEHHKGDYSSDPWTFSFRPKLCD